MAMREIKFRAWVTAEYTGEDNGVIIDSESRDDFLMIGGFDGMELLNGNYKHIPKDYYKIMQFTGLHDKNGVEIYEGDIVRYKLTERFEDESIEINSVEFNGGSFYPIPISEECEDEWYSRIISDYEVIGNIYENKELLEQ